ncbi:hypothetical protein [Paenibacillus polymyxa]|uniref:hypothetical protein n=1 Tax=Paenibacillus polymyxa TaxID=1406 RepID=UPI001C9DC1DB|nr:hypothetical protein [Paenibacillus polymyxa]MBY7736299.1 hypothetical protein [Paenibacillus polymyxa]
MEIDNVAKVVHEMAQMFEKSYWMIWNEYTHPAITEKFKFEEVSECLDYMYPDREDIYGTSEI